MRRGQRAARAQRGRTHTGRRRSRCCGASETRANPIPTYRLSQREHCITQHNVQICELANALYKSNYLLHSNYCTPITQKF